MIPEVEIAVLLARDLPRDPRRPYTRQAILDAVSEMLVGIELIERRIPKGAPFSLNLADDLGNIGYVVGDAIADFAGLDLKALRCRFWAGGELRNDRQGGHSKGDPLIPLVDWANRQRDHAGGLRAGQIVTLGSLTPMAEMEEPADLKAEIESIGRVNVRII
jgi:2-keto-4-pentenoate hydratase